MRHFLSIPLISAAFCLGAEPKEDLMSFANGDQLHGHFSGIDADSSLLWKRDDVGEVVKFKSSELRRVVLRGGEPIASLRDFSHIGTVNGDRIPGRVRELNDKQVIIETEYAGIMEFPRDQVGLLAPMPLGGRVLYHGPFDADQWSMINSEHPDGIPDAPGEGEKDDGIPRWKHAGSAWYWQNKESGTALVRKSGVPDRAVLRFDISWKSRLSLAIAFHSDFKRPDEIVEDEPGGVVLPNGGRSVSLPGLFGNSYVLHLYSSYVMLYRTSFDDAGRPRLDRVQTNNSSMRLGETGKATIEIRCNRLSGDIKLFVDGEFAAQWSELEGVFDNLSGYAGKGDGFGFVSQSDDASVRISEVTVAEWNGMPDSARSMQVEDSDIVLLANGTDRFSGKVIGLHDGLLKFEGRFGDFEFPIAEIAEVRFAKSRLAEVAKDSTDELKLRFHPIGRISGKAIGGDGGSLRIRSATAGEIDIKLDSAVMLEFRETGSFLDDWNDEF